MDLYRNASDFLNSLTLIDHNFGTKSEFELKQKTF